jgi:hypothetical protein
VAPSYCFPMLGQSTRRSIRLLLAFSFRNDGYTYVVLGGKEGREVYWYNPTTRTSERVEAPSADEQAIEMLAGDPQSVAFVSEYARLRESGMEIEQALILVGHEFRLRHLELVSPNAFRPRAAGYNLLVGAGPSSRR